MAMTGNKEAFYHIEESRTIPIVKEYDVIVVGGSPSGCAAAICAARQGVSVIIVERNCFLGGQAVGSLVVQWEKRAFINNLGAVATRGIAKEILDQIIAKGNSDKLWEDSPGCEEMRDGEEWLDVEAVKHTLLEMCLKANVDILFDTLCVDVFLDERDDQQLARVKGIILENKSGRQAIKAKVVVDASAYLDVVWFAVGEKGVIIQPPEKRGKSGWYTWFGGVDSEKFVNYCLRSKSKGFPYFKNPSKVLHHLRTGRLLYFRGFDEILNKARQLGYLNEWKSSAQLEYSGDFLPNTVYVKWLGHDRWAWAGRVDLAHDTLDAWDLSHVEINRQIFDWIILKIFRLIPGWENAYISRTSTRLGLRETRILKAVTMITTKDVFDPNHNRPDAIGRSSGHDPGKNKLWKAYPIPYGALIPKDLDGVICCSRSIGVDLGVPLNAHRGIVATMVVGEAAGTAAGLVALKNLDPRNVDIRKLRETLRKNDVVLDVETVKLSTIPKKYYEHPDLYIHPLDMKWQL
jgi:ribulose 1,5-bisphosphate synthetase/thiazole synthase